MIALVFGKISPIHFTILNLAWKVMVSYSLQYQERLLDRIFLSDSNSTYLNRLIVYECGNSYS